MNQALLYHHMRQLAKGNANLRPGQLLSPNLLSFIAPPRILYFAGAGRRALTYGFAAAHLLGEASLGGAFS